MYAYYTVHVGIVYDHLCCCNVHVCCMPLAYPLSLEMIRNDNRNNFSTTREFPQHNIINHEQCHMHTPHVYKFSV